MSVDEQTIKCPICGRPYKFFPFKDGDQSACPTCVAEAERNTPKCPPLKSWRWS